ncbi:MAG: hypothetical protein Q8M09_14535 [Pseudomonadota bacterium]|nr:hypothetical protein [Pseudomonadota bacterium]MDP1905443.1 hypothetical protein [Pseudomonadota bacterium]MDP2354092.1 hypothetical protein [Pseudomonadota bacterium]
MRIRTLRRRLTHYFGPNFFYQISSFMWRIKLVPLAELFRYLGVFIFHCDISYKSIIGQRVSFPHYGLGTVVGKYVTIGDECVVMPGVLLGATLRNQGMPNLGKGVVIGAGAKVLGAINIGEGAVVAANSVVTMDVAAFSLVGGNPSRVLKDRIEPNELDV